MYKVSFQLRRNHDHAQRSHPFPNQACFLLFLGGILLVHSMFGQHADLIPSSHLINPADLVALLQSSKTPKPLVLQVGSHVLFSQAHIAGSEYVGVGSSQAGLEQLRQRVEKLPRGTAIVIYCGCCPWNHCPNVKPADDALREMGFTNVKVLYIPNNFGSDWVDKGYPVAKGD